MRFVRNSRGSFLYLNGLFLLKSVGDRWKRTATDREKDKLDWLLRNRTTVNLLFENSLLGVDY